MREGKKPYKKLETLSPEAQNPKPYKTSEVFFLVLLGSLRTLKLQVGRGEPPQWIRAARCLIRALGGFRFYRGLFFFFVCVGR